MIARQTAQQPEVSILSSSSQTMESVSETRGQFLTHRKYVRSFAVMCGHIYGHPFRRVWEDLAALVRGASTLTGPAPSPKIDDVRKSLANAWGTEYLLALNYEFAHEDDIVRLTNVWAVVQAYYVHYHAIHALLAAHGRDEPTTHASTQATFSTMWAGRPVVIPPCSLGFGREGPVNAPPDVVIDPHIHPWSRCDESSCFSLAVLALRTTRGDDILERKRKAREQKRRERRKDWEREEAERIARGRQPRIQPTFRLPRLTREEHHRLEETTRTYTLMDYLYRLRVKSNYLDSTMFTDGPSNVEESYGLLQDLKDLAGNVLFIHELHVREAIGVDRFVDLASNWISEREGPRLGVMQRLELLQVS
jgi:hypothetical protein